MTDFIEWASSNDYLLAWLVYLLGVVGLLIVAWRLSRSWPRWLSLSLRFVFACMLLVPAVVESERVQYAPALVVAPFNWITQGPDQAQPAITALVYWTIGALLLVAVFNAIQYGLRRKQPQVKSDNPESA